MEQKEESQFGIVGLGVMAGAYARNLYFRGFKISTWTINEEEIKVFELKLRNDSETRSSDNLGTVKCYTNLREFVNSLTKPRKLLLLITAGNPVDSMLEKLLPLLERGDILLDGGNEWYKNTDRRILICDKVGIRFSGMGISGGERGALKHPCFMFGGNLEDYNELKPILSQDNRDFYVGPGSSGHYVKMVHNGIEYAILQVLCELYKLMKHVNMMNNSEISRVFREWHSESNSYLLNITQMILDEKEGECYLVDKIKPCISSNGTGKWTVQDSFDRGVPVPSIGIAVDMRSFSNLSESYLNPDDKGEPKFDWDHFKNDDLKSVYLCSLLSIFSQGMHLLHEASKEFNWDLNLSNISDIWSSKSYTFHGELGNSIISCELLVEVSNSYKENDTMLILHPRFKEMVTKNMNTWKDVVKKSVDYDLPVPATLASLQYIQIILSKNHCHNLIQAQRDCFGSHSFQRVDLPGKHHHNWWENANKDV